MKQNAPPLRFAALTMFALYTALVILTATMAGIEYLVPLAFLPLLIWAGVLALRAQR